MMRRFCLDSAWLGALLCALASPGTAQEPESPEALVGAYMSAMKASDWDRLAGYMHPDALTDFKDMFAPIIALGTDAELTALFGLPDAAAYPTADASRVFTGFMASVVGSPEMAAVMANTQHQIIGGVPEQGTDIIHVVVRGTVSVQGMTITQMEVMPVRQDGGRWRAMLSGDLEGMATMLKQQLEMSR
jgi:hypothetical protein